MFHLSLIRIEQTFPPRVRKLTKIENIVHFPHVLNLLQHSKFSPNFLLHGVCSWYLDNSLLTFTELSFPIVKLHTLITYVSFEMSSKLSMKFNVCTLLWKYLLNCCSVAYSFFFKNKLNWRIFTTSFLLSMIINLN